MLDQNWLELGVVDRVHGLQGAVVIRLSKNIPAGLISKVSTLFLESSETKVPYPVVRSSAPTQHGMVIWLEDVRHRDEAQKLLGSVVWIKKNAKQVSAAKTTMESLLECIGYRVMLTEDLCGQDARLVDVQQLPGQIMLEVEEDWGRWLCPFQPSFIAAVEPNERIITLNPPGGLRDFYRSENED